MLKYNMAASCIICDELGSLLNAVMMKDQDKHIHLYELQQFRGINKSQ